MAAIFPLNKTRSLVGLATILIVGVAVFLRSISLSKTGYWIDEMSSIHFAGNHSWGALFWDNSPPLYHFTLKIWIMLFGDGETATRSLSVLISTITTLVWAREGYRRQGLQGLILAGGLQAILGLSVLHGRETRMYALFELASGLFFILMMRLLEGESVTKKRLFAVVLLMLFSHYLAVLPIGAGFLLLIIFRRGSIPSKVNYVLFAGFICALLATTLIRWDSLHWQEMKFVGEPWSRWPWEVLGIILGGPVGAVALVALVLTQLRTRNQTILYLLGCFILIFVAAVTVGFVMERSVFLPRYYIYVLPLIVGMASRVKLFEVRTRAALVIDSVSVLAILVFAVCQGLQAWIFIQHENPPWRDAAQIIGIYPKVKVFTTRPLSLRSPYFDAVHVPFEKLVRGDDGFNALIESQTKGEEPWILENYWGFEAYRVPLAKFLLAHECKVDDHSRKNSSPDPIILLRIDCESVKTPNY